MNHWFVAVGPRGAGPIDWRYLKPIETPRSRYYADPFLLDGYLFFEEYDHKKGVISVMDLKTQQVKTVLEEPFHLSYPCVFKHDEGYGMIPEGGASGQMWLYTTTKGAFPFGWQKTRLLWQGNYADPQFLSYKGQFYIFFTSNGDNELRVLKFVSPIVGWVEFFGDHRINSRSAGNIYEKDGRLYRPVQDCTKLYGGAIIIREIEIGATSVHEKDVERIDPTWHPGLIGTHTINFDEHWAVIDGKIKA